MLALLLHLQGPRKGEDDRHKLKVALEDLYNGKTCRLAVTRNKICSVCEGLGGKPGALKTCEKCQGRGVQVGGRRWDCLYVSW